MEKESSDVWKILSINSNVKVYILLTTLLVIASLLILALPSGSQLQQCKGIILSSSRYSCYTSLAISSKNASFCSFIPSPQSDNCYALIANETKSFAICKNITQTSLHDSCITNLAYFYGNATSCLNMTGSHVACTLKTATDSLDAPACSTLDFVNQTICTSSIAIKESNMFNSSVYCASAYPNVNSTILGGVMRYGNLTSTVISSIPMTYLATASPKDACYLNSALRQSNSTLCDSIKDATLQSTCVAATSELQTNSTSNFTQQFASCDTTGTYKELCQLGMASQQAIATKNASVCGLLSQSMQWECYSYMAQAFQNTTYCGFIVNVSQNSACISQAFNVTTGALP